MLSGPSQEIEKSVSAKEFARQAVLRHRKNTLKKFASEKMRQSKVLSALMFKKIPPREPEVVNPEEFMVTPRSLHSKKKHAVVKKIVRVKPRTNKPFCNVRKYDKMVKRDHVRKNEHRADPFYTMWEKELESNAESRKHWVAGPFIVTDHKAAVARRERIEASDRSGLIADGEYKDPKPIGRDVHKTKFLTNNGFI